VAREKLHLNELIDLMTHAVNTEALNQEGMGLFFQECNDLKIVSRISATGRDRHPDEKKVTFLPVKTLLFILLENPTKIFQTIPHFHAFSLVE
jgi:hypothetical protein